MISTSKWVAEIAWRMTDALEDPPEERRRDDRDEQRDDERAG